MAAWPDFPCTAHTCVVVPVTPPSPVRCSNEGGCEIGNAKGGVIGAQFKEVINFADTTRPITGNSEWSVGSTDSFTQILDVMTCS
jgi:hypothetical protein